MLFSGGINAGGHTFWQESLRRFRYLYLPFSGSFRPMHSISGEDLRPPIARLHFNGCHGRSNTMDSCMETSLDDSETENASGFSLIFPISPPLGKDFSSSARTPETLMLCNLINLHSLGDGDWEEWHLHPGISRRHHVLTCAKANQWTPRSSP